MEQVNHTTKRKKGKHLNYEERIKIEALHKANLSTTEISLQIGCHERTIRRELARGAVTLLTTELMEYESYSADVAQDDYKAKGTGKGPQLKIGNDHKWVEFVEKKVKEKYSPYAILQLIVNDETLDFDTKICFKTLYNYIDMGLFMNISNKDLPVKKDKAKRNYNKIRSATTNSKGTSISQRAEEIETREEYGHWEIDSVVGKQGTKAALVVLSERKTREELIFKVESKCQSEVIRILNQLETDLGTEKFSRVFKTITADNGCEFLNFEGMENSMIQTEQKRTKIFFCHPYSSWERGTNENINKMIRRFIPKGVDIGLSTLFHTTFSRTLAPIITRCHIPQTSVQSLGVIPMNIIKQLPIQLLLALENAVVGEFCLHNFIGRLGHSVVVGASFFTQRTLDLKGL